MTNFWHDLPEPFFILAPMEAVTDVVFRHVVAAAGEPDVFFTEFTNSDAYSSPKGIASTRGRLTFTPDEQPIVAQIWGKTPEHFAQMAKGMKELGFAGIDINMGCPDKSVVHGGAGSGLIRTPELANEIIAAVKSGGLPVSVKTRLGDVRPDEWRDWLTNILKQDVVNLTIHLRTRKEMSKVAAHYELIPEIIKLRDEIAPQTLLTINGDVKNRAHGLELIKQHPGIDGIMIGRGIFTDPFAFAPIATEPSTAPASKLSDVASRRAPVGLSAPAEARAADTPESSEAAPVEAREEQLLNLLRLQLDLFDNYVAEHGPRPFDPLKRFFKIYVRDFEGASELRDKLMHAKTTTEVRELLAAMPT